MSRSVQVLLIACGLSIHTVAAQTASLTLSEVKIVGTERLTPDDVARGLGLKVGAPTHREDLLHACTYFRELKLFESLYCRLQVQGNSISLVIFVNEKWKGMPLVFDNFVWTTRAKLIARLKQEIPLFMPELPERCGLTDDIVSVLEQIVDEDGIRGTVRYDDVFWTERGLNVFFVQGISTSFSGLQIEGENAPAPEAVQGWFKSDRVENFSAARLNRFTELVINEFYKPRGYLRPVVEEPEVQFLGEKDGTYPVRLILRISAGDLYTFGSVKFEGVAREHSESLLAKWKLKPGDPYDEAYAKEFIHKEVLEKPWAQSPESHASYAAQSTRLDEVTKRVSLTVSVKNPRKTHPALR